MTLDCKILRRLYQHERLKPCTIETIQGNVSNLPQLKQVMNIGMKIQMKLVKIPCYSFRILSYQNKPYLRKF